MKSGPVPMPLIDRLMKHVTVDRNGCWIWTGSLDSKGYGKIGIKGRNRQLAHRISWEVHSGVPADGMCICHSCDTPACINPEHLFIGTNLQNVQDMARKGRAHWNRRP